ncbi:hypothetical protein KA183_01335 [bacterium]|nr:hypothetical protein [bacterium]
MTKSSESHDEGERHFTSSIDQINHSPDVQAAKLAGASDIKAFQSTNSNLHSGTAGGDAHESIQIVALDERGKERIVAERPKVKPENDHPENFDTSTLLAIEAKTNPVAKVISLFRNWIENLPSGKQKEEYREVSRAQAAELSPEIKDQLERNKQLRGSVEYTHVLNTPSGWMEVGQKISQLSFDDQAKVIGSGLLAGINHYQYEDRERTWGQLIGTVEGLGEVAIGLAKIADFTALLILNDPEKIAQSAAEFRLAFGQTIASGIKLFQASDQYLYNIGFEGDYSKPFRDIQTLGTVLNQRWSQLTPRDQERIKANLITQLSIDGLLGIASANNISKTGKFTQLVDMIASDLVELSNKAKSGGKKIIQAIDETVEDLLTPAGDTGLGIKLKIPRDPVDEIRNDTKSLMIRKGEVFEGRRRMKGSDRKPYKWPIIEGTEDFAENVIRQSTKTSCVSAIGEMLSSGKFSEEQLRKLMNDEFELKELANVFGPPWTTEKSSLSLEERCRKGSWGAIFWENIGTKDRPLISLHAVTIDALSKSGKVSIRDPWEGTKYEMYLEDFLNAWNRQAIYRK